MKPKVYRATVEHGDGWLIAEVTGLRAFNGVKGGIVTQGRDLNELAYMVRDAIEQFTDTKGFAVELLIPPSVRMPLRKAAKRKARKAA